LSTVGQKERAAQDRVVELFTDKDRLDCRYLGNLQDRQDNSNVIEDLLRDNLLARKYDEQVITKALFQLQKAVAVGGGRKLYEANRETYALLRYGAKVAAEPDEKPKTIHFIDWKYPEKNDFAIAEEVTVFGEHEKRPDIVIYVNGIALGVLELKRSLVNVSEGIRQNIGNQKKEFIRPFFSTVQLLMAGNDSQGLRYGVIETPEKYWLNWKEPAGDMEGSPLDIALQQVCEKKRFLEVIHDFIVFDAGIKKTCRHNQYFGVKEAQKRVEDRDGGIIWHAQGSGKSLTMVWLAKWIRETQPDSRVFLITDREELDEQIEKVFHGVSEDIYRTKSGKDLVAQLNSKEESLVCSLIHKFGKSSGADSIEEFIKEIRASLPNDFSAKGNLFVFVDECHRTQSGKMHSAMKELLPGAMFVGFTGTPLLKKDKPKSVETFGTYIHEYKFDEAVRDEVILDLRYEARDIDQVLTSEDKVDAWFEAKTKGLTESARAELKKRWGTMQKVLTSKSRAEKIVKDIIFDMDTRPRLMSDKGNAILVSGDIGQACKFYELFEETPLKGKVAIVTSYSPYHGDIANSDSGEAPGEELRKYQTYRKMLADFFEQDADKAVGRSEEFEQKVKKQFIEEPGKMKLLIVVDKLLTGFDAPPATYLYIDKKMQDHNLFQAVCRVNRLDGEDKEYGYIIDYESLLEQLSDAYGDYTGDGLDGFDPEDVEGLLKDRLLKAKEDLDAALEQVEALCEAVEPPKETVQYLHYFCTDDTTDENQLLIKEPRRIELYKSVRHLVRAYGAVANEMGEAGYSGSETDRIRGRVEHFEKASQEVRLAAGENIDFSAYEADMRYLIDNYIDAKDSRKVISFDERGLVQILAKDGADAVIQDVPSGIGKSQEAVAETIENNVRRVIIDEQPINPKYFEKMSELLDALIEQRRQAAMAYTEYLKRIEELAKKVTDAGKGSSYPEGIRTKAQMALYDNVENDADLALALDAAIRGALLDGWRGTMLKERKVEKAIEGALTSMGRIDDFDPEEILELARHQEDY
jgi:type I restriction enzyme R subunit